MENKRCDYLIDYFNGLLSENDSRQFEQHLQQCEDCQKELQEFKALTEDLPLHMKQVDPPEGMKDRVLDHVMTNDPVPSNQFIKKKNSKLPIWSGVLAAALLLSVGVNIYTTVEMQQLSSENENLNAQLSDAQLAISELQEEQEDEEDTGVASPEQTASLVPLEENGFTGMATVTDNGEGPELLVQVQNMEALHGDEVYQVWLIEEETPVASGSFVIDEHGVGGVSYHMSGEMEQNWESVAVSKEPQPGNEQPEGEILLESEL
ncbi:anti-sigma-K factor RskA [Geomicrobium halophilum]|uniref:Anti-sigma-W factor RsiW n=1 Tax=Geomicrobium halophilum TaxID=549000 RepID=A0A841PWI9_9BACL|nr:anti-sigma factor [Geomicrobium halophilum]MBB6448215.1 anti-sigma-K factor RskA [Geomicrobium halophilum]